MASRQHGVVARWQLAARGVGRHFVETRLASGRLRSVHTGVYAVGHMAPTRRSRWMAAVLAGGPGAVLSHRSAAQLWGMLGAGSGAIHVTRSRPFRRRERIAFHRSEIPADERAVVERIPVTSAPRTIVDLAAVAPADEVERALNQMEVLRLTDALSVLDLLARYPRRAGTRLLRRLFAERAHERGVTRNDLESGFLGLLRRHGLPPPLVNADLELAGRFIQPDCMWRDARLVVELDGRGAHATRRAFERDRERDRLLLAAGWRTMRVTWRQLQSEGERVAADLRRVLSTL